MALALKKDDFYTPENLQGSTETISPSGRYKLVVSIYSTKKGCWNYSRGQVYRTADDEQVADVKRNYSQFPFLFMEDHLDGHDYLICGEHYQGQTFCQLDTGKRKDQKGTFCWGSYTLLGKKALLVDGCFWAAPYEYKVFDVSDPMKGWPEYKLDEKLYDLEASGKVTMTEEGQILWENEDLRCKKTGRRFSELDHEWSRASSEARKAEVQGAPPEEVERLEVEAEKLFVDEEDEKLWDSVVDHRIALLPADGELKLVSEWMSEELQERKRKRAEAQAKRKAQVEAWVENDPFFSIVEELSGRPAISYPSRMDRWKGETNPALFYLWLKEGRDLRWGSDHGPIKAKKGKENREFERSEKGLRAAWK
ncbi:hypothetical protein CMI37_17730 [Candidatus Pacearchaeota archaeon]|nr:hypothetical protein [Candidatus Pacearchaeota archaeon]